MARTVFDVRDNPRERLEVAAREDLMRHIARESGGKHTTIEQFQPAAVTKAFEKHLRATYPDRLTRTEAWDRWWMLTAALLAWAGCWALRRRSGLI